MDRLLPALLHPIVSGWRKASDSSWRRLPRPLGDPIAYSAGPNGVRILLLGGGIAVGYGTVSHDLALAGQVARQVTALTGRGVSVDVLASPSEQLSGAQALLHGVELDQFHAVLATYGGAESATFVSARRWRLHLEAMLDSIEGAGHAELQVFIAAVPLIDSIPGVWGRRARRRAQSLNAVSRRVCEDRDRASFAAIDELEPGVERRMNRDVYRLWASSLAPQIAVVLDRAAHSIPMGSKPVDDSARQVALDDLDVFRNDRDEALMQVVADAREFFHVSGARIDVIDNLRRRVIAADGMSRRDIPRRDSISELTMREGGLHIEDTDLDDRAPAASWANEDTPIRFYAGYPIEARDGHRVGTMCVVDSQPRAFSQSDQALLKRLALQAQSLLGRL